jgi:uncharacterized membrane protein
MSNGASSRDRGGLPATRIEALSDGVFAIAMTVLVLNIQVPEGGGEVGLLEKLSALLPKFAAYATSFLMLGVLWIGHHFQFHYIRRTDRTLLWINLLFLLAITFLPFSTGVLANYYSAPAAILLYGGTLIVAGSSLLGHWVYATAGHRLVSPEVGATAITSIRNRVAVGLLVYASATVMGLVDTRVSLGMFLLMPVLYLIPTRVDRVVAKKT